MPSVASPWWNRKVARLPSEGTLLVATDLQGNLDDYAALKRIYRAEKQAGRAPVLVFCGDLVHGPGPDLASPEVWPDYLGAYYVDRSADLIVDFMELCRTEQVLSVLGNHEHAHVGGPVVSKFHDDEAAVLEARLGASAADVRAFMQSFPLVAVAPCGVVCVHGAPRATEADTEAFEHLRYGGYDEVSVASMVERDTLGALLWSRAAEPWRARELLRALQAWEHGGGCVVFGHDVVREGYERIGDEQLCLSSSFGCDAARKTYLRVDLAARYHTVHEFRCGCELLPLYP